MVRLSAEDLEIRFRKYLNRIRSSETLRTLPQLFLEKYLFLTCALAIVFCSNPLLEAVSNSEIMPLYYTLGREYLGIRPNNWFGLLSFAEGDLEQITMIVRIMYVVLLIPASFLLMKILAQFKEIRYRAYAFTVSVIIMFSLFSQDLVAFRIFSVSYMFAFVMLEAAFLLVFTKGKAGAVAAVILTAVSQLAECRTIILIIPVLIVLIAFKQMFESGRIKGFIIKTVMMLASAALVLVAMQIITVNSKSESMETIVAHLYEVYLSDGNNNTDLSSVFIEIIIETFEDNPEIISLTPLSLMLLFIEPDALLKAGKNIVDVVLLNNNFLCMFNVTFAAVFLILKKHIMSERKSRFIFAVIGLSALSLVFSSSQEITTVLVLLFLWAVYHYHYIHGLTIKPDIKKILIISAVLTASKFFVLIFINDMGEFSLLHYVVSYQLVGLAPRVFIATIFQLIFGYHISRDVIVAVNDVLMIVITITSLLVLKNILKYVKTNNDNLFNCTASCVRILYVACNECIFP